jgi:5-methylcytosine-specific restriction endonuclease McrA
MHCVNKEMKKHHAKVKRVHVVDFLPVLRSAELEVANVMLADWEFDKTSNKSHSEQLEEKRESMQAHLTELLELQKKARISPVFLGSSHDVPSQLVSYNLMHPYPLNERPWFFYVLFHDNIYEVTGPYTEQEFILLVLEEFDRERRLFEKLHSVYVSQLVSLPSAQRERIPQRTRIFVWRRDGGKCARCGGRERLEYDHIVPVSRGGSNTARNIELLCETCNRKKSDQIQ